MTNPQGTASRVSPVGRERAMVDDVPSLKGCFYLAGGFVLQRLGSRLCVGLQHPDNLRTLVSSEIGVDTAAVSPGVGKRYAKPTGQGLDDASDGLRPLPDSMTAFHSLNHEFCVEGTEMVT